MKKAIKSFPYIIPLFILGAVLINADIIRTNSDNLNTEETELSADSNIEIIKLGLVDGQKNPDLMNVQPVSHSMSGLVFIPSSHDFGTVGVTDDKTFNFQLKNNGSTSASGNVFLYGDYQFSCISGCSYNLYPGQSQYVSIRFTPCDLGEVNTTIYAGSDPAIATGTGTWIGAWCY